MARTKRREAARAPVPREAGRRRDASPLLLAAALIALTFVVYLPALAGGFLWDDDHMVYRNAFVRAAGGIFDIWLPGRLETYFPLTSSMFWVEWRLFGESATGYRIVNLLLHALAAIALWRVLLRLRVPGALVAAAAFAVHPVTVASAAWIAERKNTLSLALALAALLAFLRSEDEGRGTWYWAALGVFALALLAKTAVVTLPIVILVLAWYRRGRITRDDVLRVLPFLVLAAALALITIVVQREPDHRPEVWTSRIAATGWATWFYLATLAAPFRLVMIYPRWEVDPTSPLAWVPLLGLAAVTALCWQGRATWGRPVLAAIACFVALLLPVLGLVGWSFHQYSLVSDHLQYVAMAAPIALAVGGAAAALRRQRASNGVAFAMGFAVLAGLSLLTWQRAGVFASEWTLWQDTLAKNPDAWAAQNNLGRLLADSGRIAEGERHYREALRLNPRYPHAHNNLGVVLVRSGNDAEAEEHYREALRLDPGYAEAHSNLGNLLARTRRVEEAVEHQRAAARIQPESAEVRTNLAIGLADLGRYDEALAEYDTAIRMKPGLAPAHYNRGAALFETGRYAEAADAFAAALQLDPGLEMARNGLAQARARADGS
jgi:tetratricopeptide (TPR) repeat protein